MVDVPAQVGAGRDGATGADRAGVPPAPAGLPAGLAALLDQLPGAIVAVDLEHRITAWNAEAQELYGWTAHEVLGRSVRDTLLRGSEARADEVVATTRHGQVWEGQFQGVRRKDGTSLDVWVRNAPLHDADGTVVGVLGVSLDISEFTAAMAAREVELQAARRSAERLADRNARLAEVSGELARALTARQVVEVVLQQGVAALGADAGGVALRTGDHVEVLGAVGYEPAVVAAYERLSVDAVSPVTDVLRDGPVRTGSRAELLERYPDLPHSALSESFVGVPLEVDGRVIGVMAVSSSRSGAFPEDEVDFLVTLGRQCAQALERGRLFAAERGASRRMAFLAMASERLSRSLDYRQTLDAVAALAVPAAGDWCSVHLLDGAGRPQLVTIHHRTPELQALLVELFERYPPDPERGAGIGQAVGEGRTVHHRAFPEAALRAIARDDWHLDALRRLGMGSALVVPLVASGRVIGVLTVTSEAPDHYSDADVQLVEDLARRMATAVDNAVRYGQERETALTLQQSLLPRVLPDLPGLTLGHRYLPGAAGAEVGGDWYDVIPLAGGRIGLVIGDVMGRGIAAAAVMGQVRAAVRAYAMVEQSPAVLLGLVDAALSSLEQTSITTCLYGVYDPVTRRLRLASAGHLPPLLVHTDGGGEYVELEPGPPLGVAWEAPEETEVDVPAGAVLLLFTDGLVEGREQPVEDGMLALRNAVARASVEDVQALCDELLRATGRDGSPDDDSALLAVRTCPRGAPAHTSRDTHLHLAGHLSEVARARRLAVEVAGPLGVDVDDTALLVTELASNALRHGGPGVDLWLRPGKDGRLRVEMIDGRASSLPRLQQPDSEAEGGRGLVLVSALADAWGTDRLAAGKCVWFELRPGGVAR